MIPRFIVFALISLSLTVASNLDQKHSRPVPAKAAKQSKKAVDLLERAMSKPDVRIPRALLAKTVAVAVITDMKTFGFLIEGAGKGSGVVTRRFASEKWSAPAYIQLSAISIRPQLNARSFNVILLFMNDKSANWLLDKKSIVFDRDKAPVAGPVGEINVGQKEVVPVADVFCYVFDDGRLQSLDLKNLLQNLAISFDNDLNRATYGVNAADILSDADREKVTAVPAEVTVFSEAVARLCAPQ